MQKEYEKLLGIIPDHPAQRIMHFVERHTPLVDALAELTRTREYEYLLFAFDAEAARTLAQRFALSPHISVKPVTHDQARYHRQAKMYDFVFVEAAIPDPTAFLRRAYPAIKNAGTLLMLSHDPDLDIDAWREGMEEHYYVAFSTFELDGNTQVISGKKMHGWGE